MERMERTSEGSTVTTIENCKLQLQRRKCKGQRFRVTTRKLFARYLHGQPWRWLFCCSAGSLPSRPTFADLVHRVTHDHQARVKELLAEPIIGQLRLQLGPLHRPEAPSVGFVTVGAEITWSVGAAWGAARSLASSCS